jgi:hypothetical protein
LNIDFNLIEITVEGRWLDPESCSDRVDVGLLAVVQDSRWLKGLFPVGVRV